MFQTKPGDQSHDGCPGEIYVGDGYVEGPNGKRIWGPRMRPCGTCEGMGRIRHSVTRQVDAFTLIDDPYVDLDF